MNRKTFLKTTGLTVAALAAMPSQNIFGNTKNSFPDSSLKVALIGVGARGIWHLDLLLKRNDVVKRLLPL